VAKFKRKLDDMYVDESFDEYYDRIYKNDPEMRSRAPVFGDDTGKGMGGAGTRYDRSKNPGPLTPERVEAADAPVRRAEERLRKEAEAELKAKREGKRIPKYYKKGGMVSASKRADGIAIRGKTKGRMV
jgi:hypothetical protein